MRIESQLVVRPALCLALMGLLLIPGVVLAEEGEGQDVPAVTEATQSEAAGDASTTPLPVKKLPPEGSLSRSSEGLVPVTLTDGTIMLDLQGRFMVIATAKVLPDGTQGFVLSQGPPPPSPTADAPAESPAGEADTTPVTADK